MAALFGREVTVTVDALKVTGLRCAFKIEKTLEREPNTLDLQIYNLSAPSRAKIQAEGARVQLFAGYVGSSEMLFTGDATIINHGKNGADWITRLQSGDGSKALRRTRVSEAFASGTKIPDAMKTVADKIGIGVGNALEELKKGNLRNALTEYSKGYVACGVAGEELDKMARTMGREFSVQDGAIQLSAPGVAVGDTVAVLRADTGLVGSPEIAEVKQGEVTKTIVKVRSLIQAKLLPGRRVKVESRAINGAFRVEKVTFTGDTHDQPWYADLELVAL